MAYATLLTETGGLLSTPKTRGMVVITPTPNNAYAELEVRSI